MSFNFKQLLREGIDEIRKSKQSDLDEPESYFSVKSLDAAKEKNEPQGHTLFKASQEKGLPPESSSTAHYIPFVTKYMRSYPREELISICKKYDRAMRTNRKFEKFLAIHSPGKLRMVDFTPEELNKVLDTFLSKPGEASKELGDIIQNLKFR
jgi:hypothetical protein